MTILSRIVEHKRKEVARRKTTRPLSSLVRELDDAPKLRDFRAALIDPALPAPRVIAEIKRRSPSRGLLRPGLDPAQIAAIYGQNGAAALSVLADERFFGGSLADLLAARNAVSLPVLCKEFVIDAYQVYEARLAGADAILLIAAVLNRGTMRYLRAVASDLGMAALVEVHNEAELDEAVLSGAEIIGINNRDLHTFEVSLETTHSLLPRIPANITTVSESGIRTVGDRAEVAKLGVDALLVGEGLVASADIAAATREIAGMTAAVSEV